MPDILIRGMEMPHIHDTVRFAMDYGSGKMIAINQYEDNPTWHFVEELPPHGDLCDRSVILAQYDAEHEGEPGRARTIIENAPVVVPAERREG